MAKVFTITEGLENMGALKTGGQGSVYKGRRTGEIITAIKLIPTPITRESHEDKNYATFINEVEKLTKANEDPNPNVVKILSWGITESGNFPYIEMEFIEGPDLEELLQPPHDPVFTISEALKVADQLSFALAHCHNKGIRHGDIKSNNVKYNTNTGNYVLLDFGLAVMSDEQRRTSFRQAGAIEFMAPEQSDGQLLFQSDVYSFGIILFELLGGNVPFPLKDRGEISRNHVVVAHRDAPPPDLPSLRRLILPAGWNDLKRESELNVPDWLISMIYKCLEKKPENRFANGMELHEYIGRNRLTSQNNEDLNDERIKFLEEENKRLRQEREHLQEQLKQLQPASIGTNTYVTPVMQTVPAHQTAQTRPPTPKKKFKAAGLLIWFFVVIAIAAGVYFLTSTGSKSSDATAKQKTIIAPKKQESAEVASQLQNAKQFINQGKMVEALTIYNLLSKQEIPEAMYEYGKLALQNKNNNITCVEAVALLAAASDKGFTPAKRTLGLLYSFADDEATLKAADYYERCNFNKDVVKGPRLLMEAMLEGDETAANLLDELKRRQGRP